MADILIGVDAGTSLVKAVAFDCDGRQLGVAATPNRYQTGPDGAAFQSLEETWKDCAKTLRALAQDIPGLAERVVAIGVTGQGDGTWLVDRDNRPVAPGWLWMDGRAGPTVRRLRGTDADRARYLTTGTGLNVCQQGAQLAHMKATTPELIAAADAAMHCKDWLYLNLTGVRATDPSEACFTFGDFRKRVYDDVVIDALGLRGERRLLPPIVDGAATTHALNQTGAAATGLKAGTPVSLGYVDVVCTALGAGIVTDGAPARCTILGSTGMHMRASLGVDAQLNEEGTGYTMALPIPDMIAQMQSNMAATLNIDWMLAVAADLVADVGGRASKAELIDRIEAWIGAARPGSLLFHPYISEAGERGPFVNNHARAGFNGLNASHRFPDLVRGVVEGLGMAARDCYAAMGGDAQRSAVDRRRRSLESATRDPGGLPRCAGAGVSARGGRRSGGGDDRGLRDWRLCRYERGDRALGDAGAGRCRGAGSNARQNLQFVVSRLCRGAPRAGAGVGPFG